MKFQTHNDKEIPFSGSRLVGFIDVSYAELKKKFGKPSDSDGHKVDVKWEIEFEDGTIASIYNYKDGKNYNGASGIPTSQIRDWYIGGVNENSVDRVGRLFPKATTRKGW